MQLYYNAVFDGILYSIMALGLYITFRILRFADLTTEASFTLGAAVAVSLISQGTNPIIASLLAIVGGMLAGLITGILMTYFEIPSLLSSIITLTGLYSVNLRVMQRPNINLRGFDTVFSYLDSWVENPSNRVLIVGLLVVTICILLLASFFKTDLGQAMIATGDNEIMAKSIGINSSRMKILALMLANGLIGFCGAFIAQNNGFADVTMGNGVVVIAMSSIVIGEVMFKNLSLTFRLVSIVIGSIIYQLIIVFVLQLGLHPTDFRLISALVMAIFLAFPTVKNKFNTYRNQKRKGGISA
ncbi:ABC transporter permease [Fundicoccus culcitae]|uniref:ABC transporter permease n=1 Tax=Fundicoccus culcitae TaxID=2969821 RepID=A0ABY5P7L7_9LACT|nr:ABC transporter permease [Fundicoccus culcitae]UUX34443.1 ABC transporter permease [Fundicoccus culcitae]